MRFPFGRRTIWTLAVAVVAAIVFHGLRVYLESRPRFYEDAWKDAVSVLKEEVGAEAVDLGAFSVPRAAVYVPRRAYVCVRTGCNSLPVSGLPGRSETVYVIVNRPASFLAYDDGNPFHAHRAAERE